MSEEITGILTVDLVAELRPTVDEVAAILRARTRSDTAGTEIGTFDSTTRPTGVQVEEFIDSALDEVVLRLPETMSARYVSFVRRLTALRAAMYIETSYDPDRGEDSAYTRLKEQFDAGMPALLAALDDAGEDASTTGRLVVATVASPYSGDEPATTTGSIVDSIIP